MYLRSMTNRSLLILVSCLFFLNALAQDIVPPLDIPLKLSGTFGEFRATHFHAGLDIKTQGQEGLKVKAVQTGSIRRIRVATSGYGKCLYIQHADGTTSVYAHLQKFAPKIEALVKAYQYEKERFVIQRFLKLNELTVEKGEVIGYSGNTGGSEGPHLHFEIRDTKAETPLNPLAHGISVQDSIRPIIQGVYRYALLRNRRAEKIEIPLVRENDSVYSGEIQALGGIHGFGVRLFDRQDLSYSRNGIYKAELLVNGSSRFSYTFDKINFDDGKKINTLIDYPTYKKERIRIQKLFRNSDVGFSFLAKEDPNGYVKFEEGRSYQIQLVVEDFEHNKTYVSFYAQGVAYQYPPPPPPSDFLTKPHKDYLYMFDQFEIYLPKETFFDEVKFNARANADSLFIKNILYPQRQGFELKAKIPKTLDSLERQQLCLAMINTQKDSVKRPLRYVWTTKNDSLLTTKYAYPGTYVLAKDSLAPTVEAVNFKAKQWMSNYNYLKLKVKDDFSGIKSYRATINDQWILMEYEPKDDLLTYNFDDIDFKAAKLNLNVEIEDNVGNKNVYTTTIFRKPSTR